MKILERKEWSLQKECTGQGNSGGGCHSLLEIERDDLRYYENDGPYSSCPRAVLFRCPVCGQLTDLDKNEWPRDPLSLRHFSSTWARTGMD